MISGIIKVEIKESVISQAKRPKLITLTETLIISAITKTEPNNCFIRHCFEENNDKHTVVRNMFSVVVGNHALRAHSAD